MKMSLNVVLALSAVITVPFSQKAAAQEVGAKSALEYICRLSNVEAEKCKSKAAVLRSKNNHQNSGRADDFQNLIISQYIDGDLHGLMMSIDNAANISWTRNDFAQAIKWFGLYRYLYAILDASNDISESHRILSGGRWLPLTRQALGWRIKHQGIRFYWNVSRSKHSYLCGEKFERCLENIWILLQGANYSSTNGKIYDGGDLLYSLTEAAKVLNMDISDIYSDKPKETKIMSKEEFLGMLPENSLSIGVLQTMECRKPLVWTLNSQAIFKIKEIPIDCTTSKFKEVLKETNQILSKDAIELNSIEDLEGFTKRIGFLDELIFRSGAIPSSFEGRLTIFLDEAMSGVPFELLPTVKAATRGRPVLYASSIQGATRAINRPSKFAILLQKDHPRLGLTQISSGIRLRQEINKHSNSLFIENPTTTQANRLIRDHNSDLIVVMAHGIRSPDGVTSLSLGDDYFLPENSTNPTKPQNSGGVALLLACGTGHDSNHLLPGESVSELASRLFSLGFSAVIAPRWVVDEQVASDFGISFVNEFISADSARLEIAFESAIRAISTKYRHESVRAWILMRP